MILMMMIISMCWCTIIDNLVRKDEGLLHHRLSSASNPSSSSSFIREVRFYAPVLARAAEYYRLQFLYVMVQRKAVSDMTLLEGI